MALTEKTLKVLNFSEIPEDIRKDNLYLSTAEKGLHYQVHIDNNNTPDDDWIKETYPELIEEESFLLYIDI